MKNRIGSLFSGGIDGMMMGFQQGNHPYINYTPHVSIDIENVAVKMLKDNYSHRIINDDIRNISYKEFEECNVLCITAPCPEYSNARNINSNRKDTTQKEKINGKELYLHGFRVLALVQPDVFIAENVPEFLDYRVPTECFTELKPYDTFIYQLDTQDFNLPQARNRVFFVGFKKKWPHENSPDPLKHQIYEKQLTVGDIKEKKPVINIPNYVKTRIDGGYRDLPSIKTDGDLGNTCVAHYGKDRGTTLVMDENGYKGLRPFTPREYARLMGIPDDYKLDSVGMTTQYRIIGNSVSPVICNAIAKEVWKYLAYYS